MTSLPMIVMLIVNNCNDICSQGNLEKEILHNLAADDFFLFSPKNGRPSYFPLSISITNSRRSNGWRCGSKGPE